MAEPSGPYVQTAAFCDQVIEGKDGVLSLIRVVDRLFSDPGAGVGEGSPPPVHLLTAVVMLKSGSARGGHMLRIRPEAPSGLKLPEIQLSVLFEGEDRGVNVMVPLALPTGDAGLYWFDILVGDQLLTRMPLRVVHQAQARGMPVPES